jgi:hypothetical protein
MIIKQDDVTDDTKFRGALSKEIDKNTFPGIDWNKKNEKFIWEIDEIAFCKEVLDSIKNEFGEKYPNACNEFINYMNKHFFQYIEVTDFLREWGEIASKNNDDYFFYFEETPYTIRGEVYAFSTDDKKETATIALMQYKNDRRYILKIIFNKIPSNINSLKQYSTIQVSGYPYITGCRFHNNTEYYTTYRDKINIRGESFKVISEEPEKITEWKNNIDPIWYNKKHTNFESKFGKIDLIAPANSNGESDFKSVIGNSFEIIPHPMALKVSNIVETIQNLNKNNSCDCICIVRGGGNPYDLIHFSDPRLLKAIYDSSIPIVIGVGHSTDDERLECNKIADKACINPSEAARFFLELKEKWNSNTGITGFFSRLFN